MSITMVNGKMGFVTEEANSTGLTDLSMKGIGSMIWLVELVDSFIPMGMSMKDSGSRIKLMVEEFICIEMEHPIQANGSKTNSMGMVLKFG